jgi:hypothetical protein
VPVFVLLQSQLPCIIQTKRENDFLVHFAILKLFYRIVATTTTKG